jgi:hypothetical protein
MDTKNPFFTRQSLFQKKAPACPNDPSLPNMQIGSICDANLGNLRETIKNAMIPLLIKVFELKLAAQQAKTPPSRLQKPPKESLDEIQQQLGFLLKDLDLLHMWCESSQKQVVKAMKEIDAMLHEPAPASRDQSSFNKVSTEKGSSLQGKEGERLGWLRKFFSW